MSGDRIHAMNPDGSDRRTIVTGCHLPDGIVVDGNAERTFWRCLLHDVADRVA
jgi:hypothetical protein